MMLGYEFSNIGIFTVGNDSKLSRKKHTSSFRCHSGNSFKLPKGTIFRKWAISEILMQIKQIVQADIKVYFRGSKKTSGFVFLQSYLH
jgi:hypothetical protein